jgi:sulfide:quinone oxidoreductase
VVPEFNVERVEPFEKAIYSYDDQKVLYDLLVSVPVNMGATVIERSGIGNDLSFVPTEKHTLKSKEFENVFVLGDATDLPSSKAGSVAHFEVEGFVENFLRYVEGHELQPVFDGHANCFVETGYGKGLLIDFNYDVEPLPGKYPLPGVGPFSLLHESHINHWGKQMFRWAYWNILLKGRPLPVPARMSMAGKQL